MSTQGTQATAGLRVHTEEAGLPGYTQEGAQAPQRSNIGRGKMSVDAVVGGLMDAPLHRHGMLAPSLTRVGVGSEAGFWVLDLEHDTPMQAGQAQAVGYPAAGQADTPPVFAGHEEPDPLSAIPGLAADAKVGYPISLHFYGCEPRTANAELTAADGQLVPIYLIQSGATVMAVGGQRRIPFVLVFPREPLQPSTSYNVRISSMCGQLGAQTYSWHFSTRAAFDPSAALITVSAPDSEGWQAVAVHVRDAVAEVDRLGFAALYCCDHYNAPGMVGVPSLEMTLALTYLADHSERLRFGPLVAPLSYRDPAMLARQAMALDDLSGGRMVLGIGAGWIEDEHRRFGYDVGNPRTRIDRLAEGLEVITRLCREDKPVSFEGRFYRLQEAQVAPRSPNPRGPTILVGGKGMRRLLPLIARFADVWTSSRLPLEVFAERTQLLDGLLERESRPPQAVKRTIMDMVICWRDEAELERRIGFARRLLPNFATLPTIELLSALRTFVGHTIDGTSEAIAQAIRACFVSQPQGRAFAIEAQMQGDPDHGAFGIFRQTSFGSYRLGYTEGKLLLVSDRADDGFARAPLLIPRALAAADFSPGSDWHTNRFEATRTDFRGLVDGQLLVEIDDDRRPGETDNGVWTDGAAVSVRDYRILEL